MEKEAENPEYIKKVLEIQKPQTVKNMRQFLGLINFKKKICWRIFSLNKVTYWMDGWELSFDKRSFGMVKWSKHSRNKLQKTSCLPILIIAVNSYFVEISVRNKELDFRYPGLFKPISGSIFKKWTLSRRHLFQFVIHSIDVLLRGTRGAYVASI